MERKANHQAAVFSISGGLHANPNRIGETALALRGQLPILDTA